MGAIDPPRLDDLASRARTALVDPCGVGLPDPVDRLALEALGKTANQVRNDNDGYAIDRLDDIINLLNPSEWDAEKIVRALRVLGTHLEDVRQASASLHSQGEVYVGDRVTDALRAIQNAIQALTPKEPA